MDAQVIEFVLRIRDEATAAAARFKAAMGENFAGLQTSTGSLVTAFKDVGGAVSGLGGVFAGLGIGKIVQDFVDSTSKLSDLSKRVGIDVVDLQKLKIAAENVGIPLEQVVQGIVQLQNRIAGGDKAALQAIKDIGISLDDLKRQSPHDQIVRLGQELSKIPDPAERTERAIDLDVAQRSTLLPMLVSDIKKVGDEAVSFGLIMNRSTVQAVQDLGDLQTRGGQFLTGLTAHALKPLIETMKGFFGAEEKARWESFKNTMGDMATKVTEAWQYVAREVPRLVQATYEGVKGWLLDRFTAVVDGIKERIEKVTGAFKDLYDKVVGNSYVPDMLAGIGAEFAKLPAVMVAPAEQAVAKVKDEFRTLLETWSNIGAGIESIGGAIRNSAGRMIQDAGKAVQEISKMWDAARSMSNAERAAATVAGAAETWSVTANQPGRSQGAAFGSGAMAGARAGAAFAPMTGLSIAAGAIIGGIMGAIRDLSDYEERVRANAKALTEMRAAAYEAAGGIQNLQLRAQLAAPHLVEMLRTNDAKFLATVLNELDAAFKDLQKEIAETWGKLADGARGSGETLDASLSPFIQQLRNAGVITEDLAGKLLGMTTENSASWQQMQGWAEKYGIQLGSLGQTFNQQRLDATAGDIITAFEGLIRNGADYTGVLAGMTDEINEVVRNSQQFGTTIPENMRPWIANLIASGDLLGLNKDKITDINTLNFGPEMKSDIQLLNETLRELIDKLGKGVPAAIATLAGTRVPAIRIPIEYDDPGFGGLRPIPQAAGGDWWVTKPTLFLAGEGGPERATFTPQGRTSASAGGDTRLTIELEGMPLWEGLIKSGKRAGDLGLMAVYALTIAGVSKEIHRDSLSMTETANARNVCKFDVLSADGSYRPASGAEVVITEDAVRIFAGTIADPQERGLGNQGVTAIVTTVNCTDFNALADKRKISDTLPTNTLKWKLQALVAYLSAFSITLDAAQVTGPTLAETVHTDESLASIFDKLGVLAGGYVWEIDYNKVLRMFLPSATWAPFNIVTGDDNAKGDIIVTPNYDDVYTAVIVKAGSGVKFIEFERHYGTGAARSWAFDAPVAQLYGVLNVYLAGVFQYGLPVGIYGVDDLPYTFDYVINGIRQRTDQPLFGVTDYWEMSYDGNFPITVRVEAAGYSANPRELPIALQDVFDKTVATNYATELLPQVSVLQKTIKYLTYRTGLKPGMSQTVNASQRNFNGTVTIREIHTVWNGTLARRTVVADAGTKLSSTSWRASAKRLGGGGGGGALSIAGFPSAGTGVFDPSGRFISPTSAAGTPTYAHENALRWTDDETYRTAVWRADDTTATSKTFNIDNLQNFANTGRALIQTHNRLTNAAVPNYAYSKVEHRADSLANGADVSVYAGHSGEGDAGNARVFLTLWNSGAGGPGSRRVYLGHGSSAWSSVLGARTMYSGLEITPSRTNVWGDVNVQPSSGGVTGLYVASSTVGIKALPSTTADFGTYTNHALRIVTNDVFRGEFNTTNGLAMQGALFERARTVALGEWADFSPSWTNVTIGNGTVVARWTRVGRTAGILVKLTFGSTTAVTGGIRFTLPVDMKQVLAGGHAEYLEAGVGYYGGVGLMYATSVVELYTNASPRGLTSATVPFTWGTGDILEVLIFGEEV